MKIFAIAAALAAAIAFPAQAGPYVGLEGVYQSVSLDAATRDRVPSALDGFAVDAGWRFGHVSLGGEYSNASGAQNGNNLSANRFGIVAAYHFTVIPGVDSYAHVDGGQSSFKGFTSTFAHGAPTTTEILHGTSNDFGAGVGVAIPIWNTLAIKLNGGYRSSTFGGHADGGPVVGLGFVLAR